MATPLQIVAQLREASTGPLRAWVNDHAEGVARLAQRAILASAGRELGKRDVGPKIGGARKDQAALLLASRLLELEAISPGAAYKAVTKGAVLGEFDVHAARAAGDTAGAAYAKHELYRLVAARPGDSPRLRADYVKGCTHLREHLPALHTADALYWFLHLWGRLAGFRYGRGSRVAEYVSQEEFDARFPKGRWEAGVRIGPREDQYELVKRAGFTGGWDRTRDGRIVLLVETTRAETDEAQAMVQALGERFTSAVRGRGAGRDGGTPAFHDDVRRKAGIYERADDWSWSEAGEAPAGQPRQRNEFVFVRAGLTGVREGGPAIGRVTGEQLVRTFGLRALEHGNWMADDDADTGEAAAFGAFTDLALLLGLPPELMGFRGRLGLALGARGGGKFAAHYEPSYRVINLTKTKGAGTLAHEWGHALDHWLADAGGRSGGGVYCSAGATSGSAAIDAAFREVMLTIGGPDARPRDERKRNPPELKTGEIESLNDLNERISVLNGWYAALQKQQRAAVNARDEEAVARWKAESDKHTLAVLELKKLQKRFNAKKREAKPAKRDTRRITTYYRDAELLGDYWQRPQELFARAWEAWVEDTLLAKGWLSTYLVTGTRVKYSQAREWNGETVYCEPYPQGAEREVINAAMARLAAALRAR